MKVEINKLGTKILAVTLIALGSMADIILL